MKDKLRFKDYILYIVFIKELNHLKIITVVILSTLESICKAFGITLSQFFADDDSELIELNDELKELFNDWMTLSKEQQ